MTRSTNVPRATRIVRVLPLAGRLTAGGGRESLVRLALTSAGLALAVTLLLSATVLFPALQAHDAHRGWTETSTENRQPAQDESTTDPLLWQRTTDRFDGRDILRVDVHALGPDAPVPPGLDRLPGPGEIAVSPALQYLLDSTDPALLANRFPGQVTATVGRDALASPDDLVAIVGRAAGELVDRSERHGVLTVRSIEVAPIDRGLGQAMRLVLVVGGLGLLVPVVVFVATATRLAAARRERRLAALRLAGATNGQVGWVSAVEALTAAAVGVAAGFAGFLALRPTLARIPFDGYTSYAEDLRLSAGWAVTIGLGVPALAVAAALVSLRRVRISPLGTARQARPSRASARPLLLVAGGIVLLLAVSLTARRSTAEDAETYGVGLAFVMLVVGIVLSGPWLTAAVARGIARVARRAPSLLAARRLQDNPAAAFRAISGIVLAVFVGSVFSGLAASIIAGEDRGRSGLAPAVVAASARTEESAAAADGPDTRQAGLTAELPARQALSGRATERLLHDLTAVDGVSQVVTGHAFPDDPELVMGLARSDVGLSAPVLVSCDGATALGFGPCEGTTALNMRGTVVEPTGFIAPITVEELTDLPVVAVAAVTDGDVATVESARTLLQAGVPGGEAVTRRDVDAGSQRELRTVQRVSNLGLAVTLVIAGCSLAVAVTGAIVERKQPLALLRLTGVRLSELRRMVPAEAAAPLLIVAGASVGLGLAVAALVLQTGGGERSFVLPGLDYWLAVVGGLALALLVVLATLPLLDRLTAPDNARFE